MYNNPLHIGFITGKVSLIKSTSSEERIETEGEYTVAIYFDPDEKPHKIGAYLIGYAQRVK